ncbi:unnamed protein product [Rotaria sp. Silwood2]|nr:unnamed protein product [Rotaria sp. Silwood2]CAF2539482.1 unnamed protein product [Rotaria sp. Silwood2]CAF2918527.1 unnamed protein product [Rotaria sp. Silwood2]CAF4261598.1 unnamed protein product [Rotaria sp. Silwood2]CAF4390403.1 unnamed protein product [Rotaria sp. Silwood2]
MSSAEINIFLTDTTGYVGGSILTSLLQHSNASNFHITALTRRDNEQVNKLVSINVMLLIGSNNSFDHQKRVWVW